MHVGLQAEPIINDSATSKHQSSFVRCHKSGVKGSEAFLKNHGACWTETMQQHTANLKGSRIIPYLWRSRWGVLKGRRVLCGITQAGSTLLRLPCCCFAPWPSTQYQGLDLRCQQSEDECFCLRQSSSWAYYPATLACELRYWSGCLNSLLACSCLKCFSTCFCQLSNLRLHIGHQWQA